MTKKYVPDLVELRLQIVTCKKGIKPNGQIKDSLADTVKLIEMFLKYLEEEIAKGEKMEEKKKFMKEAVKKPGALRKTLKVKEGEKIPEEKLKKAEHSKNPLTRKRATLAETFKRFRGK